MKLQISLTFLSFITTVGEKKREQNGCTYVCHHFVMNEITELYSSENAAAFFELLVVSLFHTHFLFKFHVIEHFFEYCLKATTRL